MTNKLFRLALILAVMLAGIGTFTAAQVSEAQCTPNNPPAGATVTCTGTDSNGYYSANGSLTVNVNNGATVVNPNDNSNGIRIPSGNTVNNNGSIEGVEGGDGIKMDNNNRLNNNSTGVISSEHHDAVDVQDGNTIVNNGTIITDGPVVTDGDKAIDSGNNTRVTNNGTISGNGDGVFTGNGSVITNNSNGVIHSEFEDGIDGKDRVTVNNYGEISTGMTGANEAVDINNYSTVNNYGTIDGYCDGIDILREGTVNNAEGGEINGERCNGVDAGAYSEVTNAGDITTGTSTGISGVEADYGSTVTNTETGDITGRCRAVRGTSDITVVNEGDMHGEICDGVDIDGVGTVTNSGTITTNADAGVEVNSGTIVNEGTGVIDGASNGIKVTGTTGANTTITNDGLIQGNVGINASSGNGNETVINNGSIVGETGTAIRLGEGNDTVSNLAGAEVIGTMDGGTGTDILEFRYRFEATSFYIPAEYRAMEATVLAAPTTGCPCTISLVVSGTTYRYRYTNFEQLKAFLEFVQLQYQQDDHVWTGSGVAAYALTNNGFRTGSISVYETDSGQGVHVVTFDAWQVGTGKTFTGTNGWSVIVDDAGTEGTTRVLSMSVRDPNGAVRTTSQILLFNNGSMAWR